MAFVSGDMLEIFVSHSELGQYRFSPKANESFNIIGGGVISNDDESGVTANGQMIDPMNMTRWSVEGPIALDFISGNDSDMIKKLSRSPILGNWTFSHISGTIWQGSGKPVGAHEGDSNTGLATLKVAGGGELAKIG